MSYSTNNSPHSQGNRTTPRDTAKTKGELCRVVQTTAGNSNSKGGNREDAKSKGGH